MERVKLKQARVYAVSDRLSDVLPYYGKLWSADQYARGALDAVGAVVYAIDRDFRIVMVNREWDRFALDHGGATITSAGIIGKHLLDCIAGEQREMTRTVCEAIFEGRLRRHTLDVDCSATDPLLCQLEIAPLRAANGAIIGATFTCRDVTAQKLLEAEVNAQYRQLQTMAVALRQREARANLLQRIAEALNSMRSLAEMLQVIAGAAVTEGIVQAAAVYLVSDADQSCVPVGACGVNIAASDPRAFACETSLAGQALRTRQMQVVEDTRQTSRLVFPALDSGAARTVVALPLLGDDVRGVLEVYATQPQAFDSAQVSLLVSLADQAAVAIRTARSFERDRRRSEMLRLLNQVGEHLGSELRTQAIVEYVTNVLVDRLGFTFARVWLFDNIAEELVLRSSAGLYTQTSGPFGRIKLGQHTVGRIAASSQPFVTNDVPDERGLGDRDWAEQTGIRSFAGYPLIARDRLLGVVGFFHRQPLDDDLIRMMEPFVHQVSLALERAQLYVAQVAARREAQAQARLARDKARQLSATLTAMGDGVWTCDREGRLLTVNRAALTMFGLTDQSIELATIDDIPPLFAADCADRHHSLGLRSALEGRSVRAELTLQPQRRPHAPVVVAVTATPMRDSSDQVVGAVAVVRDVTQQKALEQLRVDFIAAAAHELKTPITTLKGYTQLALMRLRSNLDRSRLQRALQTIDAQADRVVHIVQKLMDVSRMQVGRLDLQLEVVDLVAVAHTAVTQAQTMTSRHELTLEAPAELKVMADRLRISHVIQNMLDNAIKYSPEGGLIEVGLARRDDDVYVTVRDHGVGVPRDKQAQIFEPWYQAHGETVGEVGGMGLGLSVSKEIVALHGGRMWCESTEGSGSVFGFALPAMT
ncbi:MAG TPA: GAF domain-containing protein [Herpetosiphonaceae bacterium]